MQIVAHKLFLHGLLFLGHFFISTKEYLQTYNCKYEKLNIAYTKRNTNTFALSN